MSVSPLPLNTLNPEILEPLLGSDNENFQHQQVRKVNTVAQEVLKDRLILSLLVTACVVYNAALITGSSLLAIYCIEKGACGSFNSGAASFVLALLIGVTAACYIKVFCTRDGTRASENVRQSRV